MRLHVSTPAVVLAFLFALPCARGKAQQPGRESSATGSNTTSRVSIPVLVRDKHGAPVRGLAAADFTLSDNGHIQALNDVSGGPGAPLRVGLLFDTSRGMLRAMDSERKAAENFVGLLFGAEASGATPPVQAFLIHFDREVELIEDSTASVDKLHSDLEQLGPTQRSANAEGPETTDSESSQRNFRTGSPQLYDAIFLAASEVMKSTQGRKALIVFSNGIDRGSRESLNDAVEAAERTASPVYTIYFRGDEQRTEEEMPSGRRHGGMGGSWPGSGGGWPGGGGHAGGGRGSRPQQVDGRKILQQIANRTGGLYFEARKTAELSDIYTQIASDLQGQYLVSYAPDKASGDAEFHKIEVKAAKGDVGVTAPEGYLLARGESK